MMKYIKSRFGSLPDAGAEDRRDLRMSRRLETEQAD